MPALQDLIDELEACGVVISGRSHLLQVASEVTHWPDAIAYFATEGRKSGVGMTRHASDSPSDLALEHLLEGYPFTTEQRWAVLRNILVRPE